MKEDITHEEILNAINAFATSVDQRFEEVGREFKSVDQRFEGIDRRFERIEFDIDEIKSTMVTKDYLDEKISDLRGDLVVLVRKEDTKLNTLVNVLHTKRVLDDRDVGRIESMEPFSKSA